ncbi:SDR family NAD(P)-dependent oxidoreductase [Legionella fallonii]|uniref:Estradiol 17-beta-dehydrogenase n=1 Tax=Legionella fallonii LLAP-10 TaxID=1212491 RepID=A0A098G903_9GAMM|nr:SDR family NAD(P)-dependent oxidoreductase [Legionella fallonii]CEG58979.1 Estradiol 17-beta-dehydrogenase [Legionella fallonii LLAP-10]
MDLKTVTTKGIRSHKAHFSGWKNAVVLITGASRGIGRAMAKAAADRGAKVGLMARSQQDLELVLKEIDGQGVISVADVSHPDDVKQAIQCVAEQLGPIDILINCAGIGAFGSFNTAEIELFEKLMRINFLGVVYTMKAVLPSMVARHKGCIINIASVAGRIAAPLEAAYSASKFAVVGLTESVQNEVRSQGVHVSMVLPGPVETDFFATRGSPYPFESPKPVSPQKVVNAIIAAVEQGFTEKFVPSWLSWAYTARALIPSLHRMGINHMYSDHLKCENIKNDE